MIVAYLKQAYIITAENQALLKEALWIDLLSPTREEEHLVEHTLQISIPTPEDMHEIELSSRLYKENGNLFMTAMMIANSQTKEPTMGPVTFMLTEKQLITIRFIDPQAFKFFTNSLEKNNFPFTTAIELFAGLLDATIDRLADILEWLVMRLDNYSKKIFQPTTKKTARKLNYPLLMQNIGSNGDLNTKIRESLITFNRLVTFFIQANNSPLSDKTQSSLATISKDITALGDHATFLSAKINFLLDATLGLVNIEQNAIIKIFSVAAVIFLPPTLLASIYGMNFHFMPELSWKYGYVYAICLMILSALLPYLFFKKKKWL